MKKIFSLILAVLMLCGVFAAASYAAGSPFKDVKESRWSYTAIKYAYDNELMDGVGGGKFDPTGTMTRAMVVTVLWRMDGREDVPFASEFDDVKKGQYYSTAVMWAKQNSIVNGVSASKFDPNGKITREQLATMLNRYAEFKGYEFRPSGTLSKFPDADKAHSYAKNALLWATAQGIITGVKSGSVDLLDPRGNATREQFATILMRFADKAAPLPTEYNLPVIKSHFTEPVYSLVTDADVYVATDGDDSNPGTLEAPVKTFNRAVELSRIARAEKTEGDVVVAFKAGDYGPLSVNLTTADSGTEDSRLVFTRYGDGEVVFNNGIDISSSSLTDLTEEEKTMFSAKSVAKIKKADLSGQLTSYDPRNCLVLGENGGMTLARFPNKYADGTDNLLEGAHENIDDYHIVVDHALLKPRIDKYHTTDGLLLYGYLTTGWYKDLLTTDEYDPATGIFHIPYPEREARMNKLRRLPEFDSRHYSKIAVVNISEELDYAGEYWIDAGTKTFYVYDPVGDFHVTGGGNMIIVSGTEYVTFRGLTFKNSNGYMIYASDHPRGMTIEGCSFVGCAEDKMVLIHGGDKWGEPGGPLDVTVKDSSFSMTLSTALQIDGRNGNDMFGTGTNVVIDNNYFTLTNLSVGCKGAVDITAPFATITHNHFKRCYWEDIDFRGSVNMTAMYNIFEESCYNGDDTGALQGFRDSDKGGNLTKYNLFMNIRGGTNGRYGLYLDGTSGMTIESNIFYNCQTPVMNNGNSKLNYVLNNVFISSDGGVSECVVHNEGTPLAERAYAEGNWDLIQTDEEGKWCYQQWSGAFRYFDNHPADKAIAMELWPGYFDIIDTIMDVENDWQKPEFFMNSSVVCRGNVSIKKEGGLPGADAEEINVRYSTFEDNSLYTPEENPLFVNPTLGDYSIRGDVDFPNIPFEEIGRY